MDTRELSSTRLTTTASDPDRAFPTLTPQQMSRIAAHGLRRPTARDEVLFEPGAQGAPGFVVVSGELQVLRPTDTSETVIVSHRPGQFSGESNILTGRRPLLRLRDRKG